MTVLIVDDNEAYRTGLAEYLQNIKGLELVGEAGGGQQGIYLAHKLNPDLVLMDISMPGTNGLHAAREIKQYSPRTRVVFLTIHKEETYRALGDLVGADGFITKNFLKEGLKQFLDKFSESESNNVAEAN